MDHGPGYAGHVANLTLAIDDDLLHRARVKAAQEKTSVNAVVREFLQKYAGDDFAREMDARRRIIALAEEHSAGSGPAGRTWTREDLYEERLR